MLMPMKAREKKVVVVVGAAKATSTIVIALARAGYAAECIADARDVLERVAGSMGPCDVLVITPQVSGMTPEKLLLELTQSGDDGSARRAKVPIVMVVDGAGERMPAQLLVYAGNEPAVVATAVGEVLRQCQSERH